MIKVIVVGLLKSGISTISEYLHCAGYIVWAQWIYKQENYKPFLYPVIRSSVTLKNPVLLGAEKIMAEMFDNPIVAITQMDGQADDGHQFFPQREYLDELLEQHSDAKFILNIRDVDRHVRSINHWGHLQKRIPHSGDLQGWITSFNESQEKRLQESDVDYIVLDIEHEDAGKKLDAFMGLDNAHNWGHENKTVYEDEDVDG